jgi:hypothetical protein
MTAWHKSSFSGTNTDCVEVGWHKSSFSGTNTNCVEVGSTADRVGVRDSKNSGAVALMFPAPHWGRFLQAL